MAVFKMEIMQHEKILKEKIYEVVRNIEAEGIGIAFSGGVDSSLLAKICKDVGKNVVLFTVGFEKESDIEVAKGAAKELGLPIHHKVISIEEVEDTLKALLPIVEYKKFAGLNTSIGFFHVLKIASEHNIKLIISANGADELFCGYSRYVELFPDEKAISEYMNGVLEIAESDKKQVQKIAARFGVAYEAPFLHKSIIEFAKTVPLGMKIKSKDDRLRKHTIRQLAIDVGLSESIAMRNKKAFQYSSGIMKSVRKLAKRAGFKRLEDYIGSFT